MTLSGSNPGKPGGGIAVRILLVRFVFTFRLLGLQAMGGQAGVFIGHGLDFDPKTCGSVFVRSWAGNHGYF